MKSASAWENSGKGAYPLCRPDLPFGGTSGHVHVYEVGLDAEQSLRLSLLPQLVYPSGSPLLVAIYTLGGVPLSTTHRHLADSQPRPYRCSRSVHCAVIMDAFFQPIADATGGSVDQIKVCACGFSADASLLM